VIALGTVGIRYLEAATLALLVVGVALVFVRKRPPGLVWFSAVAMTTIAAHLFVEEGRWQLVPAYALGFVLFFWLARPSARPYRAPGLFVRVIVALVAVPTLLLPFAAPLFIVPPPAGPYRVGTASVLVDPAGTERLRVWYPASAGAATVAPFWSAADLAGASLPGFPPLFATHLTLVPTPALHRAPVLERVLPLLLVLPDAESLPGDYLGLELQAASDGWLVVRVPGQPDEERVLRIVDALSVPETDVALAGRVCTDRLVVVVAGSTPVPGLGTPVLHVGGESVFAADLPGASFAVDYPDARVPHPALTSRRLMAMPPSLLVGSSDVAPARLDRALRHLFRVVLSDGSSAAPVFSAELPAQQALLAGAEGASIRMMPAGR